MVAAGDWDRTQLKRQQVGFIPGEQTFEWPIEADESSVLVVDDSRNDATIMERALKEFGIKEYRVARTAEQAVELLSQRPSDIALVDYNLPGMNGLTLLKQIREKWPEVAVVVVTGSRDEAISESARDLGAADYVLKDDILMGSIMHTLLAALRTRVTALEEQRRAESRRYPDMMALALEQARRLRESLENGRVEPVEGVVALARDRLEGDWSDLVSECVLYLASCCRDYRGFDTTRERVLLEKLVRRAVSPRHLAEIYEKALEQLAADLGALAPEISFDPAICLSRLLSRLTEHYQVAVALQMAKQDAGA